MMYQFNQECFLHLDSDEITEEFDMLTDNNNAQKQHQGQSISSVHHQGSGKLVQQQEEQELDCSSEQCAAKVKQESKELR